MSDRPILFSAPMIRALIEGRKTQTRRLCKWAPTLPQDGPAISNERIQVGDRLWVREATTRFDRGTCDQHVWYRAGHNHLDVPAGNWWLTATPDQHSEWPRDRPGPAGGAPYNVPSIHMPRWTSRLTLIVTGVKVERLQDISEADAIAEGVECDSDGWRDYLMPTTQCCASARESFRTLWASINGRVLWAANPWVAAYTFDVNRCNIDQMEASHG